MKCVNDEIQVCVSADEVISSYEEIRKYVSTYKVIDTKYLYLHTKSAESWIHREEMNKGIAGATIDSFKKLIDTTEFKNKIEDIQTIVDLGVGKGVKTKILIEKVLLLRQQNKHNKPINVVCFDFSLEMIKKSVKSLRENIKNGSVNFIGYKGDFLKLNETWFASKDREEIILFMLLGGTLGNVNEEDFLEKLSATMKENDMGILTFFNYDKKKVDKNSLEKEYEELVYNVYGPTISDLGYNLTDINIFFEEIDKKFFNVIAKVGLEDLSTGKYIDDVEVLQSKRYNPNYIYDLMEKNKLEKISEKKDINGITTSVLFKKKE